MLSLLVEAIVQLHSVESDAFTVKPFKYAALVHRISWSAVSVKHLLRITFHGVCFSFSRKSVANGAISNWKLMPNDNIQWATDKNWFKHFSSRSSRKRVICNCCNGRWTSSSILWCWTLELCRLRVWLTASANVKNVSIYAFRNGKKGFQCSTNDEQFELTSLWFCYRFWSDFFPFSNFPDCHDQCQLRRPMCPLSMYALRQWGTSTETVLNDGALSDTNIMACEMRRLGSK